MLVTASALVLWLLQKEKQLTKKAKLEIKINRILITKPFEETIFIFSKGFCLKKNAGYCATGSTCNLYLHEDFRRTKDFTKKLHDHWSYQHFVKVLRDIITWRSWRVRTRVQLMSAP